MVFRSTDAAKCVTQIDPPSTSYLISLDEHLQCATSFRCVLKKKEEVALMMMMMIPLH